MSYEETPWKNKLFYLPRAELQKSLSSGEAAIHDNPDNQVTHHLGMWDILESYFIQSMGPWAENEGSMHTLRKDCP